MSKNGVTMCVTKVMEHKDTLFPWLHHINSNTVSCDPLFWSGGVWKLPAIVGTKIVHVFVS